MDERIGSSGEIVRKYYETANFVLTRKRARGLIMFVTFGLAEINKILSKW